MVVLKGDSSHYHGSDKRREGRREEMEGSKVRRGRGIPDSALSGMKEPT